MESELKEETKSLMATINDNSNILEECLEIVQITFSALAGNALSLKDLRDTKPTCILSEASLQTEKLRVLREILIDLKLNMMSN